MKNLSQESIAAYLRRTDAERPINIPANEQVATKTRKQDNLKGVNLAVTSSDSLRTVLEDLSHLRVWATKSYRGEIRNSDKNVVQTRIDMVLGDVKEALMDTEFNTEKNLIYNSKANQGKTMQVNNNALETLGIKDLSINSDSVVEDLDKAVQMVRSSIYKSEKTNKSFQSILEDGQVKKSALFGSDKSIDEVNKRVSAELSKESIGKMKEKDVKKDFSPLRNANNLI